LIVFRSCGTRSYHALLGDFRYRYGDYSGAVQEYTRALASVPGNPDLLSARADAEVMKHDYAGAIGDFDIAIRKEPGNPDYLIERAMAYLYTGFYEKAKAEADKAIAQAPRNSALYEQRAEIEKWLDQPDESIADIDQAMKLSKSRNAELYRDRGQAYLAKHDHDHALRDLTLANKLRPDDTDTLSALGRAYHGKKQYAPEVTALTRRLANESGDVDTHLARAVAYSYLSQ
jgi:tetratricopeptide (TPR) repeat protein